LNNMHPRMVYPRLAAEFLRVGFCLISMLVT
jgi:hypothetical protein